MATVADRLPTTPNGTHSGGAESRVLDALGQLWDEGRHHRERVSPVAIRDRHLDLYRDQVGPADNDCYYKLNFASAFVDRMVAQLTDNRPMIRINPRKRGLSAVARVETILCEADWDASDIQRMTVAVAQTAAIDGSAGMLTFYDSARDDILVKMLRIGDMAVDPAVTNAARLCSDAEYVIYREIWPISRIVEAFPARGHLVRADTTLDDLSPQRSTRGPIGTVAQWIRGSVTTESTAALPRAVVKHAYVQDRRKGPDGYMLFPGGRYIIYAGDIVLWDGPNPHWDGEWPLDWFDWLPDPEHIYGHSAIELIYDSQLAYNNLMNGTVETRLLTNFVHIDADWDAFDAAGWDSLKRLGGANIFKLMRKNARFNIIPPPPVAQDAIGLARAIFTSAQLVCGVTDVTLGEHPGSLQSGIAIEGLQEGANLMTRARASRLEDFFARVGQKLLGRHVQWYSGDRVMGILGPSDDTLAWAQYKKGFTIDEHNRLVRGETRMRAMRDLKFTVMPGSSAPGSRVNRAKLMADMNKGGIVPSRMVLEAFDVPNADEVSAEAHKEMVQKAPVVQASKNLAK